jgi:hypothetical protein
MLQDLRSQLIIRARFGRMAKIVTTLPDGKICDFIDQKIRKDTPEEYVRQNIERVLVFGVRSGS